MTIENVTKDQIIKFILDKAKDFHEAKTCRRIDIDTLQTAVEYIAHEISENYDIKKKSPK